MATFAVSNLGDSGPGSLRQAILDANKAPGADVLSFSVAGTIRVGKPALPSVTDTLKIDGTSAPGYLSGPIVTVDYANTRGLTFAAGADDSAVLGLSLVNASGAGLTLSASRVTVQGNFIGIQANGTTAQGNRGDGIRINAGSSGNLIGRTDPILGIDTFPSTAITPAVSTWTGIAPAGSGSDVFLTGTSGDGGLVHFGGIDGQGGLTQGVDVPGATSTVPNAPQIRTDGQLVVVGRYTDAGGTIHGFRYLGAPGDLGNPAAYLTVDIPGASYTSLNGTAQSIPNGKNITRDDSLAVGTFTEPDGGSTFGPDRAFVYNLSTGALLTKFQYPGAASTAAYGISFNSELGYYTIAGGYSTDPVNNVGDPTRPLGHAFLVDFDPRTSKLLNWTSFDDPNLVGSDTQFQGISQAQKGVYNLAANSAIGSGDLQGSIVSIRREPDGKFGVPVWVAAPTGPADTPTSVSGVFGGQFVGATAGDALQGRVNVGFQLSNLIAGNKGYGIGVYGASDSIIASNFIGTDLTGNLARPNGKSGILLTNGAARNLIGGQATGVNDPTNDVFQRPPLGNLISGNKASGVLINKGATRNILSGNFIGTASSGNSALANGGDGVTIDRANGNSLLGCTLFQDPFVFYNVISGNKGNGVRVNNSNGTVIQANFLGAGADNATLVPNKLDGLLVSGTSDNTTVGGVIPLGNVIAGNRGNGIEIRDRASNLTSFNTFAGLFAFKGAAPNGGDGTLITSSGGGIVLRTCVQSGNLGNGIRLAGNAQGVLIDDVFAGTDTVGTSPLPNGKDGIRIEGNARNVTIGGNQASVIPQVTLSANKGNGLTIVGKASRIQVINTFIGTKPLGDKPQGNGGAGIYLGDSARNVTIGGPATTDRNIIGFNGGNGLTIEGASNNTVQNTQIVSNDGYGVALVSPKHGSKHKGNTTSGNRIGVIGLGNAIESNGLGGIFASGELQGGFIQANSIVNNTGNGITLDSAEHLTVGGSKAGAGNSITGNTGFGLFATGDCDGTVVKGNTIRNNGRGNINARKAKDISIL